MSTTSFRAPAKRSPASMPEYQRQNFATPGADASARLSDSAAGIYERGADQTGRQLMALGGAMQQAAKVGDALYVDYQTTKAKDAWLTYKQEAAKKQAELATLQGKNALGESGVEAQLSQWQQTARQNLSKNLGGMAAKLFDNAVSQTNADMDAWAVGKVHTEAMRYENKTSEAHISLLQDEALANANNPAELSTRLLGIKAELNAIAGRSGLDETWVNAEFKSDQQKILTKAIADRIEGEQMGEAASLIRTYGSELGGTADTLKARFRAKGRELEARARAEQERAETQGALSSVSSLLQDTAGMPQAERESAIMEAIAQEPDIKRRQRMASVARSEIAFEEMRISAQTQKEIVDFHDQTDGLSPLQKMDALERNNTLTDAARTKLRDSLTTDWNRETPRNQEALSDLLVKIDEGAKRGGIDPKNEQAIYAYAENRSLTPKQTKKAIEYAREGGAAGSVKFSVAKSIWTRLTGKKKMPQEAFDALRTQVPQGHAPSTAELEKLISQMYMVEGIIPRDILWDKSASLYEAIKNKSTSNWLPDVTKAEIEEYAPIVRAMGYRETDLETAIKKYKRDVVMGVKRLEADQ